MIDSPPLPSWNDSAAKSAILDFVARVTDQGGAEFVPPAGRIATFDNDGTLWCEQPLQTQFFFAFDRVKQLSGKDATMSERQPFKAVLENDYNTLFGLGKQALFELAFAIHAGMTDEDFDQVASRWLATARHPSSAGCSRNAPTGRRLSCSHTYGRTASRHISCRPAAWTSGGGSMNWQGSKTRCGGSFIFFCCSRVIARRRSRRLAGSV